MAAQELDEVGLDALNKTFFLGRNLTQYFGPNFDLETLTTTEQLVAYALEARKRRAAVTVQQELGILGRAMALVGLVRREIRALAARGVKRVRIALQFRTTRAAVDSIVQRKTWAHVL